ncbi:MAG: TIGR04282 family arsenosugar biosynthesis glycosyltransferase [Thermomonas sp.]
MTLPKQMRVGIAILVKTPGHSPLKTRLAAGIGIDAAQQFHLLAAGAVAAVARQAQRDIPLLTTHWAVAETAALDDPSWSLLPRIEQGEGDLGARMHHVTDSMLACFDAALLLGADTPQITAADIIAAAQGLQTNQHVIGPSIDGGFWLFATRGSVPTAAWSATPWSQADTATRFCDALLRDGLGEASISRLRSLRDADIADDLLPLLDALDALDEPLPEQQRLTEWLRAKLR